MEKIPTIGFGTYRLKLDIALTSVIAALKTGYRHIDTAALYKNEKEIGLAIKESGLNRKGRDVIHKSILNSLEQIDTDYLDLVLLHGPTDDLTDSWQALEDVILGNVIPLLNKVRFIGVSNYGIIHLETVMKICKIKPYANQFEISPYLCRDDLLNFCLRNNIVPVGHTNLIKGEKFDDLQLDQLSQECGISKPLLLLAWALNKGLVVLPRSSVPDHIRENIECLNIKLTDKIMEELDKFHINGSYATHPQYI
jgi:diketogulonate reductase-like aldo/keto reductase